MYADDTHLTFAAKTVSNIDSNLNEDLSRVNNWLTANKLTLNTSKTEFMMIGSRQRLNTFDTPPSLEIELTIGLLQISLLLIHLKLSL